MKKITKDELREMILNNEDIDNVDYSHLTDLSFLMHNCKDLIIMPKLKTKNVTNMENMFEGCDNLVEILGLDTSNVENLNSTFAGCFSLKKVPFLDLSNAIYLNQTFYGCENIETDLSYLVFKDNIVMNYFFSNEVLLMRALGKELCIKVWSILCNGNDIETKALAYKSDKELLEILYKEFYQELEHSY